MSANTFTYDLTGSLHSAKTAEFDGKDGRGYLLSPFFVGPANYAVLTEISPEDAAAQFAEQFRTNLPDQLTAEFTKRGFTVIGVTVIDVQAGWSVKNTGTWWQAPFVAVDLAECSLSLTWTARVTLNKSLSASPIPPWAFQIIIAVATAIIVALTVYWGVQALKDCWMSMTTDKTTVTEYNPNGTIKSTTTSSSPNPLGITSVAVGIGIIAAVGVGLYLLVGRVKHNKSNKRR